MSVWLLTAGDYSAYHVVGAFATEAEAVAVRDALGDNYEYDGYEVEEVPILSDVRVVPLWTELHASMTIRWDGRISGEHVGEPNTTFRIDGLPGGDDDRERTPPAPLTLELNPTEHGYTLGVSLRVFGTDLERVRKVFTEQRAMLIAEPAVATIRAWTRPRPEVRIPRWTFGRSENIPIQAALAEALRAAGRGDLVDSCVHEGS